MSLIRIPEKIKRLLRWPATYLLGDDIFISYSRADGATYAAGLADWLAGRGFTCRLDLWGTESGSDMPKSLKRALRRSVILVLVGTKGAAKSDHVRQEVAEAKRLGRRIVPIVFDGVLLRNGLTPKGEELVRADEASVSHQVSVDEEEALWAGVIEGLPISCERSETLKTGEPTSEPNDEIPEIVNRIEKNFTFSRKDERQRKAATSIGVLLVILIGASLVAGYVASVKGAEAKRRTDEAASAEQRAAVAEERARGAEQKAKQEEAAALSAQSKAEAAQTLAEKRGQEAADATDRANEQRRKAEAAERQRITAESQTALAKSQADEQQRAAHSNLARTYFNQAQVEAKTDYARAIVWAQKAFETTPDGDERQGTYKLRVLNLARSRPRLIVNKGAGAFSPDLSRVVIDLPSQDLGIIDARTGALLRVLPGCAMKGKRGAFCVDPVFSPDGSLVAADHPDAPLDPESDQSVQSAGHHLLVWDAETGEKKLEVYDKRIDTYGSNLIFRFTSDSKSVLVDADDGAAYYFWDVKTGREEKPIAGPERDSEGEVVGVRSRESENDPLPLSRSPVRSLALKPSAVPEGKIVSVWDIAKGEAEMTLPPSYKVAFMDFTDDAKKVVALTQDREGAEMTLRIWDIKRHDADAVMPYKQPGTVVGISGNGDALFIINEAKNELRLTGLDGRERWKVHLREYSDALGTWEPVNSVIANFTTDGRYIITESGNNDSYESELRFWNAVTGALAFAPVTHTLYKDNVVISPNGEELGIVKDDSALLYSLATPGERDLFPIVAKPLEPKERVMSARMIPGAAALLLSSLRSEQVKPGVIKSRSRLQLLDAATGRPRWSADDLWFGDTSPDGKRFVLLRSLDKSSSRIELRNVSDGGAAEGFRPPEGKFDMVVFSPDGARIVTTMKRLGDELPKVEQWDASTGGKISECVIEMTQVIQATELFDLKPALESLEGLTRHGEFAIVWRGRNEKYDHEFRLSDTGSGRSAAHFDFADPDTARLAVAALRQASRVRLLEGGVVAAELYPGAVAVLTQRPGGAEVKINGVGSPLHAPVAGEAEYSIRAFSPDGRLVLTSDKSGGLRLWEATTGQPLSETVWHDGPVLYAEFSRGGESITLVTAGGSIRSYFVAGKMKGKAPWLRSASEALTGLTLVSDLDVRELSQAEHARSLDEFRRAMNAAVNHNDPDASILLNGQPPR